VRASLAMRFAELFEIDAAQLMCNTNIIASRAQYILPTAPQPTYVAEEPAQLPDYVDGDIVKLVNLFSQIKSPQQRAIVLDLAASLLRA
jgi:hypothetical protein